MDNQNFFRNHLKMNWNFNCSFWASPASAIIAFNLFPILVRSEACVFFFQAITTEDCRESVQRRLYFKALKYHIA